MPGVLRSSLGLLSIVFTRCFTLFRKLVGNHLRSVVRLQIVDPILFLTQQRCKADAQRSAAERFHAARTQQSKWSASEST